MSRAARGAAALDRHQRRPRGRRAGPVRSRTAKGSVGLNALTGELEDLVKAGVIDPAKVTRSALQNAASIAGLLLTTEVLVADKPEKADAGGSRRGAWAAWAGWAAWAAWAG